MRTILFFCLCFATNFGIAQIDTRELIEGKINVSAEASAENINVYNINSAKGTYTSPYGEFILAVKEGDKLLISGLQYQKFSVVIDKGVMKSKKLNITVNEGVNELDEVVVKPYNLSGDVSVDVEKIKIKKVNLPEKNSKEMVETYGYKFRPTKNSEVTNDAMDKSYLTNGLNFANIFRAIVQSKKENKEDKKKVDVQVRKIYNDDFFRENLDIKKENINDFIFYAQDHGLTDEMLKKGKELELIQFLIDRSKSYKSQQP